jgi:hypothetical protein
LDTPEENIGNNRTRDYFTDHGPVSDHSENESEDLGSEITDGIRLSDMLLILKK